VDQTMALRVVALVCAAVGVASESVSLTSDNYAEIVTNTGKAAFIKFQAPW